MKSHVVRTACTLDCPDACTLDVTVTDGVITDIDAANDGEIRLLQGLYAEKYK